MGFRKRWYQLFISTFYRKYATRAKILFSAELISTFWLISAKKLKSADINFLVKPACQILVRFCFCCFVLFSLFRKSCFGDFLAKSWFYLQNFLRKPALSWFRFLISTFFWLQKVGIGVCENPLVLSHHVYFQLTCAIELGQTCHGIVSTCALGM